MLTLHASWRDRNALSNAPHTKSLTSSGRASIPFAPALVGIWNYNYRWGGAGCGDVGLLLTVVAVAVACTLGGDLFV